MMTSRETSYFTAIVAIVIVASILFGFFDDVMGALIALLLSEILQYMRKTPATPNDKEYKSKGT